MNKQYIDSSADTFIKSMYANLIGENFLLTCFSYPIEDTATFEKLVTEEQSFTSYITEKMQEISENTSVDLHNYYLEIFESGFLGRYALALWFMKFDEDNWFNFTRVEEQTNKYLNSVFNMAHRRELRLFKGFKNRGVLTKGCSVLDLPVVVNYETQTITIWSCELND